MAIKSGVKLTDLCPQMALVFPIVQNVYRHHMPTYECTITSCNDSKHGEHSLHYKGRAFDFRTKDYTGDKQLLRDEIKAALSDEFDVVLEHLGEDQEHIHVEYDPK